MNLNSKYYLIILLILFIECKIKLGPTDYNPRTEIRTTEKLDWNKNFNLFTVSIFKVETVESNLHLFNNNALVRYHVTGILKDTNYRIEKIIHTQRLVGMDSLDFPVIEIEIIPFITYKSTSDSTQTDFYFSNEIVITSVDWGLNRYLLKCQSFTDTIDLIQKK